MSQEREPEFSFNIAGAIERTGEAPFLYVNSAQIKVTPYDFQIVVGQTKDVTEAGTVLVTNVVTLVMSPQHAKAFADVLTKHVQAFEALIGAIQVELPKPILPDANVRQPPSSRSRGAAGRKASQP